MPDLYTPMPRLPFTYQEWLSQTARPLKPRSAQLKALDILVDAYIRTPSNNNLRYLKSSFGSWKSANGGDAWMHNHRNDKAYLPMTALQAALDGKGDSDEAMGLPSFMADGMASSRLGLLYLFGRLECSASYFQILTNGVLDLTDASLDLGAELGGDAVASGIDYAKQGIEFGREYAEQGAEALDRHRGERRDRPPLPSGSRNVGNNDIERQRTVDGEKLMRARPAQLQPEQRRISAALFDRLRRSWDAAVGVWDEEGGENLRMLCDFLTGQFLSETVTGILGGSLGVGSNLVKLIDSSFTSYRAWAAQRKAPVVIGTPTAIVDGIKRAMDLAAGKDLYATLKSGAQLGMNIASVGASTIVDVVCSIVEILVKAAWRLLEMKRMRAFLGEARERWSRRETEQLHEHPMAFNRWFRGHALGAPIIPALALNSNLCNNMHFLQMFPIGRERITQAQYDAGMARMAFLKDWSSRYIEDAGYQLASQDELVSEWVRPGQRSEESGVRRHLLNPVVGFLGGG